jgi:perosamine synthetase
MHGGTEMSLLNDSDMLVINELLKKDFSGWFNSKEGGQYLQDFEKRFSEFVGTKHGVAVCSGSAAIFTALKAPGDYVAVPAYTHIGSVAPILLAGAKPLFIDVNNFGNMDPEDLAKVTSVVKLRAIIVVHQLGIPCEMDLIKKYAEEAYIVEDASHALGAKYKGVDAGRLGHIGCFSIGGGRTKTIVTGEGGMITVNDEKLYEKCKNMRNHGDRVTDVDYFCFNFRMSELNALIGLLQMDRLRELNEIQVRNAKYLISKLPSYFEVLQPPSYIEPIYYIVGCWFNSEKAQMSRNDFIDKVVAKGFGGGVPRKNVGKGYAKLLTDVQYYKRFYRRLPMSERIRDESVWIDWHRFPRTEEDIDQLTAAFREIHK